MGIRAKRVYDSPDREDGYRVLVDRVWPRNLKKETAQIDEWLKSVAPSTELRKWFSHDPDKWPEFKERYFQELRSKPEIVNQLLDKAANSRLTLLYAAKDREHNNAVCLKDFLEERGKEEIF